MNKTLRKVSVMFLAIILTFSSNIAAFAATASGSDDVGAYNYQWEIGTSWPENVDYCYAKQDNSFEESIDISGYGYNVYGSFYFRDWADCSDGLITGTISSIGFNGIQATFYIGADDGSSVSNTYEVWD